MTTALACVDRTPAVAAMASATMRLPTRSVTVKVADSPSERAAGMQRLCASRVAATPMLFLLAAPQRPLFHMRNVVAPLDIAFLDAAGEVLEIHRLELGATVTATQPTSAALEASAGSFKAWGLAVGDRIGWPQSLRGQ